MKSHTASRMTTKHENLLCFKTSAVSYFETIVAFPLNCMVPEVYKCIFAKFGSKCLFFTQSTSNLVQNVHNVDLRHSRMK